MSSTTHSTSSQSKPVPVGVPAVIPLDVPVDSLDLEAQLLVPAVAISTLGERRGDSHVYNGQNGYGKEHETTQRLAPLQSCASDRRQSIGLPNDHILLWRNLY